MTTRNTNYSMSAETAEDILSFIARAMIIIVAGLALYGQYEFESAVIVLLLLHTAT